MAVTASSDSLHFRNRPRHRRRRRRRRLPFGQWEQEKLYQ
jgi:hypothetical protein